MGRHIRRPRSDLDLICPRRLRPSSHTGLITRNFYSPYGSSSVNSIHFCYPKLMSCPLSYSHATYRSYTRISPLHGKENYWHFRGVYKLPHSYLTRIQRQLLTAASIIPPTHTLHLLAILKALQLRFGSSLLYTTSVALCSTADYPQVSLIRCPDLFALHLSTLV